MRPRSIWPQGRPASATTWYKHKHDSYHQLLLHPDSRYITTFSTHAGLYRYKRLSFGINSAAEIFQQTLQESLRGSPGVPRDDILVKGNTVAEHDEHLLAVIMKLKNRGDTINYPKCGIRKQQLDNNGRNGSFLRGWLPHRGKVQMACNYCFPTRTMF